MRFLIDYKVWSERGMQLTIKRRYFLWVVGSPKVMLKLSVQNQRLQLWSPWNLPATLTDTHSNMLHTKVTFPNCKGKSIRENLGELLKTNVLSNTENDSAMETFYQPSLKFHFKENTFSAESSRFLSTFPSSCASSLLWMAFKEPLLLRLCVFLCLTRHAFTDQERWIDTAQKIPTDLAIYQPQSCSNLYNKPSKPSPHNWNMKLLETIRQQSSIFLLPTGLLPLCVSNHPAELFPDCVASLDCIFRYSEVL